MLGLVLHVRFMDTSPLPHPYEMQQHGRWDDIMDRLVLPVPCWAAGFLSGGSDVEFDDGVGFLDLDLSRLSFCGSVSFLSIELTSKLVLILFVVGTITLSSLYSPTVSRDLSFPFKRSLSTLSERVDRAVSNVSVLSLWSLSRGTASNVLLLSSSLVLLMLGWWTNPVEFSGRSLSRISNLLSKQELIQEKCCTVSIK